jgi:hypothetical protein
MHRIRRMIAAVTLACCSTAFADGGIEERSRDVRIYSPVERATTTVGSFFAPLGLTIGGSAALLGGTALTALGGSVTAADPNHYNAGMDYGLLTVGCVVLAAGAGLLAYAIVRWVQRANTLHDRYGD